MCCLSICPLSQNGRDESLCVCSPAASQRRTQGLILTSSCTVCTAWIMQDTLSLSQNDPAPQRRTAGLSWRYFSHQSGEHEGCSLTTTIRYKGVFMNKSIILCWELHQSLLVAQLEQTKWWMPSFLWSSCCLQWRHQLPVLYRDWFEL